MSRILNQAIDVRCDTNGDPVAIWFPHDSREVRVVTRLAHWREWIGILDGEPERDVWRVALAQGVCELHGVRLPAGEDQITVDWSLARWED